MARFPVTFSLGIYELLSIWSLYSYRPLHRELVLSHEWSCAPGVLGQSVELVEAAFGDGQTIAKWMMDGGGT